MLCPGRFVAFQSQQDQYLHKIDRARPESPPDVAARAFDLSLDDFWRRAPTERPQKLCWAARKAAVAPKDPHDRQTTQIITLDPRGIAQWPQWTAVTNNVFHPGQFVEALGLEVVEEFTVVVRSGRKHGDEGHIWVNDGDVIEVALRHTTDITPSPEPESGDSDSDGGDDGDESGEVEDPLPSSSEFSGQAPQGPGFWGPPVPRPVYRDRSRTPDRGHGGQQLELADVLPVPSYDLTRDSLQLPPVPEAWKTCPRPWPLDWLTFDFSQLPVKGQALDAAISWQDLQNKPRKPRELEIHLYTDGSAVSNPPARFQLHFGTLNVQGYGGRHAYIEEQLDAAAFNIVSFQETKASTGVTMSQKYLKLGTESLSRWGTAVWLHRQRGIFECGDGRPVCVDEHDIEVFAESPRLLSLKITAASVLSSLLPIAHMRRKASSMLLSLNSWSTSCKGRKVQICFCVALT